MIKSKNYDVPPENMDDISYHGLSKLQSTDLAGKDPKIGGSIIASSSMKVHTKILNILKPVSK